MSQYQRLAGQYVLVLLLSHFAYEDPDAIHSGQAVEERLGSPEGYPSFFSSGRMPEYTYLLETRLSAAQKNALTQVRDAARESGMTVFLAGGAVRDLTTGSSVRDLDFAIQGNALALQSAIEARGGVLWGRHEPSRTLFFWFPGSVRVEVSSTRSETFPKPGQPVYTWSSIVDDLRRRDFTANAMALSLNQGSLGLLLDPMNGVADIEARQLRLVSNYGFIEDPARLVRAIRMKHRLGWTFEERTATRYNNAKEADFSVISPFLRGYELEKIAAEEEALATLKALEAEGWMEKLLPAWTSASVDTAALEDLHRTRIQLLMQNVSPDLSAVHLEVLTAKMSAKDRDELKAMMVRPGLREQWEGLDAAAKEFAKLLTGKEAAAPSATWKLFHSHAAEPILWLAHTRKSAAVEAKFKNFLTVWPEAAKKVPVALMIEMRITPELPIYQELLHELFLEQIDGNLETDEQMRAFLERYSPPAPPPPVTLRRSRNKKSDGRSKRKEAARDDDDDIDDEDERPAARSDDDDDDDDEAEDDRIVTSDDDSDEDEGLAAVAELGAPRKLNLDRINLDKIDLGAVLGRINEDEDEDIDSEDDVEGSKNDVEDEDVDTDTSANTPDEPPVPPVKVAPAKKTVAQSAKQTEGASTPATSANTPMVQATDRTVNLVKSTDKELTFKEQAVGTQLPSASSRPVKKKLAEPKLVEAQSEGSEPAEAKPAKADTEKPAQAKSVAKPAVAPDKAMKAPNKVATPIQATAKKVMPPKVAAPVKSAQQTALSSSIKDSKTAPIAAKKTTAKSPVQVPAKTPVKAADKPPRKR